MNRVLKPEILSDAGECGRLGIIPGALLFAVFGKPIAHSKSPLMQNAALARLAGSADSGAGDSEKYARAKYFAFEVDPGELGETLELFFERGFCGINLTIPHKELAMGCVSELDASAKTASACNTLARAGAGWKGYNTDGFGLERAIGDNFDRSFDGADVVIIGAGGAARGAAFHICAPKNGEPNAFPAGRARSLTLANRSADRLEKLSADLRAAGFENAAYSLCDEKFLKSVRPGSIIINATSVGLREGDAPVADFSSLPGGCVFFDMPYADARQTSSVAAARAAGIPAAGGISMLVWQGAKSLSIWTGEDVEFLARAMFEAVGNCGAPKGGAA